MNFKKIASFLFSVYIVSFLQAQEYVTPMLYNSNLYQGQNDVLKITPNTFDSTFIYTTDTLKLTLSNRILDEFSTDLFQKYTPDFSDPSLTFEKYYKLMDKNGTNPLPSDARFDNQITVKRTINVAENSIVVTPLSPDTIRYSDLSVYPPVYEEVYVYPPYNLVDTVDFPNPIDTIFLEHVYYVQDSATQFFELSIDSNAIWKDNYVYRNYTKAKNPWTLGVATFDGLDENGYPYLINSTVAGYADVLTSKPIDMTELAPNNEVYLSFLYQTEGLGDVPESEDSLILQFYSPSNDKWFNIWNTIGHPVTDFKKVHIKLEEPAFFERGFQFRFMNYGRLAGDLDHFHLDYVHLRAGSGPADTLFKDFAFVYPINTFLKEYTAVPWDHYKNNPTNKMSDSVNVIVRNGSNITENSQSGTAWVDYNSVTEGNFVLSDYELTDHDPATNYAPTTTFVSYHDFSTGYRFDENKPGDSQVFTINATATVPFSQLTVNDSTSGSQVFSNYYAYDDGSAEQAYGINGTQAMLAYKFTPYEADSVIGVSMSFIPTVEDVTDKLFLITIWEDDNGKPGSKIYEDDYFFPRYPDYGYGHNSFVNYYLQDTVKVPVSGSFYIGWRQLDDAKLCIGLDRNINNKDKIFYSVNGGATWVNTVFDASLLIRPIFSTALDATLGIKNTPKIEHYSFEAFPNPTSDNLTIRTTHPNYEGAELYNLNGQLMRSFDMQEMTVNVSDLLQGIYLLRDKQTGAVIKIVKQ